MIWPVVVAMLPQETREFDMRRIIQANIDRLKNLIKMESDPTKRTMELRLIAEEEEKQRQLPPYDKKEPKAF
jgi:hypothetical protein